MIWVYRILFLPFLVLALPYYLRRMWRRGGYARDFRHRFGAVPRPAESGRKRIWIQAVSVGELLAIEPVVTELLAHAAVDLIITTTTSTGYAVARDKYGSRAAVLAYFPIDFWLCSRAAWSRLRPDLAVLIDSELWPEHLYQARKRRVPVALLNARMSDRSFARYRSLRGLSRALLGDVARVLAGSEQDAKRFTTLGCLRNRVVYVGNLKCDKPVEPILSPADRRALRTELFGTEAAGGGHRELPIILGSSTWPGEEEMLVDAFEAAVNRGIDCRLLLVPRHAERRDEIRRMLQSRQRRCHFRSDAKRASSPVPVYVADTTGELKVLTQVATFAFIGKSLHPLGEGQSPIEAAALGKPLILGSGMSNFRDIAETLCDSGAALRVNNAAELSSAVLKLLTEPETRATMAAAATAWHQRNRGATERTVTQILALLAPSRGD